MIESKGAKAGYDDNHCTLFGYVSDSRDSFVVDVDDMSIASIRAAVSSSFVAKERPDLNTVLTRSVFAEGDELLKDHATVQEVKSAFARWPEVSMNLLLAMSEHTSVD